MRKRRTEERAKYKEAIQTALYNRDDIKTLLLGDTTELATSEIRKLFKEHVKSHLFIDDTIEVTDSFIFYDVIMPRIGDRIKQCQVLLYAICHRDILDGYKADGFRGNRADILSQMVEDALLNDFDMAHEFGIGRLMLDSVDIYNSKRFYGCIMSFSVPDFR